jgi:EAL domain-containing protein (putative c-di-GMP-specific phosphodiesterase class I)/DNA-binding response OmpR family regulator
MTAEQRSRHLPTAALRLSTAAAGAAADSTVVIVDDEPTNVALLERLLAAAGVVRVHGFTDPRQALAYCTGSFPDLVLLDLHMPDLDGFAFMEALQGLVPEGGFLPVLVLTADVTTEVKERALATGAKDFLTKPFDRTEVLLRVSNLLETRALYGRLEQHNAELQVALDVSITAEREAAAEHERRQHRIGQALAPGALTMVFQPIADLVTGDVVGAEALARFSCEPDRRPDEWFAEAADIGRGAELELAAIAAALDQLHRLPDATFLAVNSSPATAITPELDALLARHPAERVVIEITEHTRVGDYDTLLVALDRLRRRGVRIAVDDTGTGYASFQHLLRLRPHILKLDTTLTRGIDADPVRRSLATALVAFATEIGAIIVAEGIEIPDELTTLQHIGVPWGQGYHLARPGPLPLPALPLATLATPNH